MAGHERLSAGDVARKGFIVLLFVGGTVLLHRFAVPDPDFDPRGLLALGLIVLAAYTVGELVGVVRIPHISGYLLAGLALGPSAAHALGELLPAVRLPPPLDHGVLSAAVIAQLGPIDALALALIALAAGGELDLASLRSGARQIGAILSSQAVLVLGLVAGWVYAVARLLPDAVPSLAALDPRALAAVAVMVGAISVSTSPAATIALVTSMRAKGPLTTAVLSTTVLKELATVLLFAVASAAAIGALGVVGAPTLVVSLERVALSMGLGLLVGLGLHLYLRYVGVELLLFLVGLVYTATFVVGALGGQPALTFLVAGAVVGNWSDRGETLIAEVERLSLPVFVVFFTLAGAKLHLDQLRLLLVPALGLAVVRGLGMLGGTRLGALVSGPPPVVGRLGWMGFVSQAGLAIALTNQVARTFTEEHVGETLFSLLLGGVAINELVGPLLLQQALVWSGEAEGTGTGAVAEAEPDGIAEWPERSGTPVPSGSPDLDEAVEAFAADVRTAVLAGVRTPLDELRRHHLTWLRTLRREFQRTIRRATARTGDDVAAGLAEDAAELALRWRDLVRALQDDAEVRSFTPLALVEALEARTDALPETLVAPVPAAVLARRAEPFPSRARRWLLRLRDRVRRVRRHVPLRTLARFHVGGEVPAALEPLAAHLVDVDLRLAATASELHGLASVALDEAAALAGAGNAAGATLRLAQLQRELDLRFQYAFSSVGTVAETGERLAATAFVRALDRVRAAAATIGTLDLPYGRRRLGLVFRERNRGAALLGEGLSRARATARARFARLEVELALGALLARSRRILRERSRALAARLAAGTSSFVREVDAEVGSWLARTEEALTVPGPGGAVARTLRRDAEGLVQHIVRAGAATSAVAGELAEDRWVAEVTAALVATTDALPDRCPLPAGRIELLAGRLRPPGPVAEVPLRELVAGLVESRIVRDLHGALERAATEVREAAATLSELERVVAFNAELAGSELESSPDAAPSEAVLDVARGMLVGSVGRHRPRLGRVATELDRASAGLVDAVPAAGTAPLEEVLRALADGHEIVARAAAIPSERLRLRLARRAEAWQGWVPRARVAVTAAVGPERLARVSRVLGVGAAGAATDLRAVLAPPASATRIPVAYRRLFSELPFDAGELLAGREDSVARLRTALAPGQRLRSAAVVGLDPHSARALVGGAVRGALAGVRWLDAGRPASAAVVEGWVAEIRALRDHAVVVENVRWLFERRPGGMAPLAALASAILEDGGRNAFVLVADAAVWAFAAVASPLASVVGATVTLAPLSPEELERAVMSRQGLSGYEVDFDPTGDLVFRLAYALARGTDRDRRRTAWFRSAHRASGGLLGDTLEHWLASVVALDDRAGTVRLGPVPWPPDERLRALPDDVLVTLLEVTRQGWTTAALHARLFRLGPLEAEAAIAALEHTGLLVEADGIHVLPRHLRAPVARVLGERGWA